MDANKLSASEVIYATRANRARLHIEEPRVRGCQADVHRSVSSRRDQVTRVRRSHTSLESCSTRVGRDGTRLHPSRTHLYIDIPLMY